VATPACVALVGPTASGKTAAALALAQRLGTTRPVEIISVDSALVYRGMDIGTAKPSAEERAQVVHHLIDIREPSQAYSAAEFVRDTQALLRDIQSRDHTPLLVGGTMLYIKALREGLDDLPPAHPPTRAEIELEAQALGWPALHQQLAQVDPVTAARLSPNDAQRISRALEVWRISGQALSAWIDAPHKTSSLSPTPVHLVSLEPQDRAWLHARIEARFDQMLAQGFLQEMARLRERGDLNAELPSMRCVGYRQAWQWLDHAAQHGLPVSGIVPSLRETGIAATRQLAKRQLTWLRGMSDRTVVACDAPDALVQTVRALETALEAT
jgi:tRNA dimethylallyltransferase